MIKNRLDFDGNAGINMLLKLGLRLKMKSRNNRWVVDENKNI